MKMQERLATVREKRLCINCLIPGHFAARCRKPNVCSIEDCGKKHTRLLHGITLTNANQNKNGIEKDLTPKETIQSDNKTTSSSVACAGTGRPTGAGKTRVALPIVPVKVKGPKDNSYIETYALLDNGSNSTFCSSELAKKLKLTGTRDTIQLTTLECEDQEIKTEIHKLVVSDLRETELIELSNVYARPNLHVRIETFSQEDISKWPHLQDVDLPIVDAGTCNIDLLIGQDVPEALFPIEVRPGGKGEPYATCTKLGWTLNGPVCVEQSRSHATSHCIGLNNDIALDQQVEKFWKLEESGGNDQALSVEDRKVITMWENNVEKIDGHYQLPIPFKCNPPGLPDNFSMANHRLSLLGKRLQKDQTLCQRYQKEISSLIEKGYAELVPEKDLERDDGYVWYLPHHPVLNPKKPDKLRVVFDCAAQHKGTSLNHRVHQGPDLTNKLIDVLIKFRQEPVAFMADVEAMFHQVRVPRKDRDVLRFLWWDDGDPGKQPRLYRMTRHLFGGVWSPSCVNYALKRTAEDNIKASSSEAVETVDKNFYVDDCLKCVSDEKIGIELASEIIKLLNEGGFRLTKWTGNREILMTIPESELAKGVMNLDLSRDDLPNERALGLLWDVTKDEFRVCMSDRERPATRRGVLSMLSSVYDPFGFVSPYVLSAKMIFQELCRRKISWDENMPEDMLMQWGNWCQDLQQLKDFSIPRCIKPTEPFNIVLRQLHHFSDASQTGYGAVSYLRLVDDKNRVHCSLMMSKAKLAPIKMVTIPRLELSAAVVSTKLDALLRKSLDCQIHESVYWTDSMIVLHYIKNESKRFQTYVANRVATIHQQSSPSQWRHVDTENNPADDVSRGLTAEQLLLSSRWKKGPEYLSHPSEEWPENPNTIILDEAKGQIVRSEERAQVQAYAVNKTADNINTGHEVIMQLIAKHSSWYKLKKSVAWILRAKQMLRDKVMARVAQPEKQSAKPGQLTVQELRAAEVEIVKFVQRQTFDEITGKASPVRKLRPTTDYRGIVHVGGRLANANLPEQAKHQWILPNKHHVVDLLIRHVHQLTGHSGVEHVLAELRQKYWVVKGRAAVKRIISKCIPCLKAKAKPCTPLMADLPSDRVTSEKAPFSHVGVDYFGPFLAKRGRSHVKRYGCIFTCLHLRAIHIEVAHSLDSSSFLNALQRFISRRGKPELIRSDNGTNFVGGQKELRQAIAEWNESHIEEYMRQQEIKWIFNPPAASHMGGVWEIQIRTVRKVLNSLVKEQVLDDEGLSTLMCQVESIINGRPITRVSDDPKDLEALTPNHLLLLRQGPTLPPGEFTKNDLYSKRRWKTVQYLANVFWKRWRREYLPTLQARQKWLQQTDNLKINDIVLIVDDNAPRHAWMLGRVVEVYPGKDKQVRSVKVQTPHNRLVRPACHQALLD